MKRFSLIVLATSLAACGGGSSTDVANTGNVPVTQGSSTVAGTSAAVVDSGQFLADAYRDGLAEIRYSQLALQKSSNDEVRTFAQAMIDQHNAVNRELARLAQNKNITLPTELSEDQRNELTRLSGLTGDDFDRAYMQLNVSVHEQDVAATRQQAQQGTDTDIKRFANIILPLLRIHLAAAEDINSVLDPNAFLRTAYQDSLAEIRLSQLALQKSTNADVKTFAQRMIDDHTRVNSQIAALAQSRGLALPTTLSPDRQSLADELSSLSGTDFDQAYLDVNVVVHAKDVRLFRRQSESGTNADVKSFAQNVLSGLQEHLDMAQSIDKTIQASSLFSEYQHNLTEIRLAYLALLQSTNGDVRAFAQRIVDDYTKTYIQFKALALEKNIVLWEELSPEQRQTFITLAKSWGADFDNAYAEYYRVIYGKDVTQYTQQGLQNAQQGLQHAEQGLQTAAAAIKTYAPVNIPEVNARLSQVQAFLQKLRDS